MRSLPVPAGHNAMRWQGIIFCMLVLLVLVALPLIADFSARSLLIANSAAIFFLGVPHGALDTVFAKKMYRLNTPLGWLVFLVAYGVLAAVVVLIWWYAPLFFLASFLVISAFHFSGDPVIALPIGARILYGGAVIVLPALLHAPQVAALFSQLIGVAAASDLASFLQALGLLWLVADGVLIVAVLRRDRCAAYEILGVVLLATFAPPLIAFTVFFCGMHSPRHFLRTHYLMSDVPAMVLIRAALIPTVACFFGSVLAMSMLTYLAIDDRLMRIIFIGLAALTVPHMLLVERVRYRGWTFAAT